MVPGTVGDSKRQRVKCNSGSPPVQAQGGALAHQKEKKKKSKCTNLMAIEAYYNSTRFLPWCTGRFKD
jgi:hypothetical protein